MSGKQMKFYFTHKNSMRKLIVAAAAGRVHLLACLVCDADWVFPDRM